MILSILKSLWNKNLILRCLIFLCAPLLVAMEFTHGIVQRELSVVNFLLLFSCFDSFGFYLTQDRDDENSELRITYRIIQDMFEIVLLCWLYTIGGWWLVGGALWGHWMTTCDKLFYILRKEPDYPGEYTWLEGWSVFLVTKYIGIKPKTTVEFNIFAAIGAVGALLISAL